MNFHDWVMAIADAETMEAINKIRDRIFEATDRGDLDPVECADLSVIATLAYTSKMWQDIALEAVG